MYGIPYVFSGSQIRWWTVGWTRTRFPSLTEDVSANIPVDPETCKMSDLFCMIQIRIVHTSESWGVCWLSVVCTCKTGCIVLFLNIPAILNGTHNSKSVASIPICCSLFHYQTRTFLGHKDFFAKKNHGEKKEDDSWHNSQVSWGFLMTQVFRGPWGVTFAAWSPPVFLRNFCGILGWNWPGNRCRWCV